MRKRSVITTLAVVLIAAIVSVAAVSQARRPHFSYPPAIEVPFELIARHIIVPVRVNDSRPLSFVFDTGDRYGVIDIDRAKELGLTFGHSINVQGTGARTTGAFVNDASFSLAAFPAFAQPVKIAFPLHDLASRLGHDFDGIFGSDYVRKFVVEVDYAARKLRLHDPDKFNYAGSGDVLPIRFNAAGHPVFHATVTPVGGTPVDAEFTLDLGASADIELSSPFVASHHLPGKNVATLRATGAMGAGGNASGVLGHLASVTIGRTRIDSPVAFFSRDTTGTNAGADTAGRIGERIAGRFRIFLDYQHQRIIFESADRVVNGDRPILGAAFEATGDHYDRFRVIDVAEGGAAAVEGLKTGDVVKVIDGKPASQWTLSLLQERVEEARPLPVGVERNGESVAVVLIPRRLE